MSERQKRTYTRDFKLAAVKKHVEQGLSAKEVASDLDIDINLIYNWKRAFQADGTLETQLASNTSVEAELKRLRDCAEAMLSFKGLIAHDILGSPDDLRRNRR